MSDQRGSLNDNLRSAETCIKIARELAYEMQDTETNLGALKDLTSKVQEINDHIRKRYDSNNGPHTEDWPDKLEETLYQLATIWYLLPKAERDGWKKEFSYRWECIGYYGEWIDMGFAVKHKVSTQLIPMLAVPDPMTTNCE